jgi:hypothetical protein
MPPAGFEPTIPASEQPQTYALDRAATETGGHQFILGKKASIHPTKVFPLQKDILLFVALSP